MGARSSGRESALQMLFAMDAGGGSAEQFAKLVRDEHESWKALIQRASIKAE